MTFGKFTVLCNHHHYLVPKYFHHPEKEALYLLGSHSLFLPLPAPGKH